MLRLPTALVAASLPLAAVAQQDPAQALRTRATDLLDSIEAEIDCRFTLHGDPQFDEFAERWLFSYSADGAECDEASASLSAQSDSLGALFVRRPTLEQVEGLLGDMLRSVRRGFACRISLRDEPRFDEESGVWFASVSTSGHDCDGAYDALVHEGRELRVVFMRTVDRQDFLLR